jgi:hypothetical protein
MGYEVSTQNVEQPKDSASLLRWAGSFTRWVSGELAKVRDEFNAAKTNVVFKRLYADPGRIYPDMVVLFDSTASSASAGEGLYIRNAANTAWSKV